ncbi:MAG TPA: M14 family zinc carboxypeptidase, partial [Bryobacteraceae bacterium]|nr:M14 family zinc carboxypeptidase [Bryobacteraceae bacterium]
IFRYMRELERTSSRVRVFSVGKSEEGREFLLVVLSDEENLKNLQRYSDMTAKLADPRITPPAEAATLIEQALPFYWATGAIHSPETGSPEMLMELAYRLAVEETPFIQHIRKNSIVMLTPVVEVDGRDKMVDVYRYRKAHPDRIPPPLIYWGKYVAHDNNRDGMALSLELSRTMMKTYFGYHPQVMHDLHESVPFLYISTGMGPYNAWLDPIAVGEWQKMAYFEIEEMTKRGVPGVWTHGFYDGWGANYMMSIAHGHNSIGRFYETFGGQGADTRDRTVPDTATSRTWFRPNPPFPKVRWSLRNNINLQQSALLLGMSNVATNKKTFLENFYAKGRRSVEKAVKEGPAAWIIPGDDPRSAQAVELVNLLRLHRVEVHKSTAQFEVEKIKAPAGSYLIRMDQPYSRMADMLLDTQFYSVNDPRPYDDTGWSLGPLRNVSTIRVKDTKVLKTPMRLLDADEKAAGGVTGEGPVYVIAHNTDNTLMTLRYKLPKLSMLAAESAFEAGGRKYPSGSFLIPSADKADLERAAIESGVRIESLATMPRVATHALATPRIALVHSWLNTQNEGWYRIAFDKLKIPYTYIGDIRLRDMEDLRETFDVIIYGPTSVSAQRLVNGFPKNGPTAIPWKVSELTPNLGMSPDQADDIRGGVGLAGLVNLQKFIADGGLFVTITGNAALPIDYGLVENVSIVPSRELQARGSVLRAAIGDKASPITYGYADSLAVYFNQAPILQVNRPAGPPPAARVSGRGTATDPDVPQGRPYLPPEPKPELKPGEDQPITEEVREANRAFLPAKGTEPRVVLKFAEEKDLLVSGMLAGGRELAGKPALLDIPVGKGHVLLFANNPIWRDQTQGSYFLLFNAMLNYAHLDVGR